MVVLNQLLSEIICLDTRWIAIIYIAQIIFLVQTKSRGNEFENRGNCYWFLSLDERELISESERHIYYAFFSLYGKSVAFLYRDFTISEVDEFLPEN